MPELGFTRRLSSRNGVPGSIRLLSATYVLDALDACPAMIRTATWDVVAWNRAAAAVFTNYGALPSAERNCSA
jgi:hypothetical protein